MTYFAILMPFFNKIPKNEIKTDRMKHDLLYAFGEIELVVGGILIALQVNDWETDRSFPSLEI